MSPLVLVAEDDADLRRLLIRVLLASGYRVGVASNGREAWEQLTTESPALLVSDVRMPERSGLDVLLQLRSQGSRLPVVLITGFVDAVESAARELGAVVLEKPFSGPELVSAVARALASAEDDQPEPLKSTG